MPRVNVKALHSHTHTYITGVSYSVDTVTATDSCLEGHANCHFYETQAAYAPTRTLGIRDTLNSSDYKVNELRHQHQFLTYDVLPNYYLPTKARDGLRCPEVGHYTCRGDVVQLAKPSRRTFALTYYTDSGFRKVNKKSHKHGNVVWSDVVFDYWEGTLYWLLVYGCPLYHDDCETTGSYWASYNRPNWVRAVWNVVGETSEAIA